MVALTLKKYCVGFEGNYSYIVNSCPIQVIEKWRKRNFTALLICAICIPGDSKGPMTVTVGRNWRSVIARDRWLY